MNRYPLHKTATAVPSATKLQGLFHTSCYRLAPPGGSLKTKLHVLFLFFAFSYTFYYIKKLEFVKGFPLSPFHFLQILPIITTEPAATEPEKQEPELISLGRFKLTAYCGCRKCCGKYADNRPVDENGEVIVTGSIGVRLYAGVSIAVDPRVIPYHSQVVINGPTYTAHDTGGNIKGNRIDVYFDDHDEAWDFGTQYAEVFIYA